MGEPSGLGAEEEGVAPQSLESLTPEQRRTLAYASAIGREFDFRLLVAAMGANEEGLAEQIERLTHLGILRERMGGDRFAFAQEALRAKLYKSLTASRLRVLHRKIAEAMERMYPDPPAEIVPELGRHYFLGKVAEKSYLYNRRAAELARADDNPEIASHHLERARIDLKGLPGHHLPEVAQLAEELGDLHYSMGDVRSADRLYTEALEQAERVEPRLRARLILARAEVARENLDSEAAIAGAKEAHAIFSAEGDVLGNASVHRILSRVAFSHGAYREALDEGMEALDILQKSGDLRILGRVSIDIGNAFLMLGPEVEEEAVEWYERAIDRLTQVGDWTEVARAYHNLGVAVGEPHPLDGLEYLARSREYAEKGHEPRSTAWSLVTGVEMRLALGAVEEAQRDNEQAGRLFERLDDEMGEEQVLRNRGLICEKRGQWDDAEKAYRLALDVAQHHALTPESAEINYLLARLLFKTRDLPRAREAYETAIHLDLARLKPAVAARLGELGRQLAKATESLEGVAPSSPPVPEKTADAP